MANMGSALMELSLLKAPHQVQLVLVLLVCPNQRARLARVLALLPAHSSLEQTLPLKLDKHSGEPILPIIQTTGVDITVRLVSKALEMLRCRALPKDILPKFIS